MSEMTALVVVSRAELKARRTCIAAELTSLGIRLDPDQTHFDDTPIQVQIERWRDELGSIAFLLGE